MDDRLKLAKGFITFCLISVAITLATWVASNESIAPVYVGSDRCLSCHQAAHTRWLGSRHHKMMRPVAQLGAIVADLSSSDIPFGASEAVWVVGSRWEQQFMGRVDGHDTLLPGAWSVTRQGWLSQGWDGWQAPDPLKRCHGCHTVGLNLTNGHFVEAGIGCESCHGPGSRHIDTAGRVMLEIGIDAAVCGQCHSRGMAKDGSVFFPYSYRPGDDLEAHFDHWEADFLQNSSQWWGTGREKKRHQEYMAWRRSGHVNALKNITENDDGRYGAADEGCLHCHAGEAAVRAEDHGPRLGDVKHGITCAVCHNSHGDLDRIRRDCASCHDHGPFHHQTVTTAAHIPCPAEAGVLCIDCHMPLTVKMGGEFLLRSHAPGITEPAAGAAFNSPSSCANGACHQADSTDWLQQEFKAFYRATTYAPTESL